MIHPHAKRRSQRVSITLPLYVHERINILANEQGRSSSNLMAYLIERGLDTLFPDGNPTRLG